MSPSAPREVPTVLVIVVAYHADDQLEQCLLTLCLGPSVIVVDNDTSGTTRRIVDAAGARYVAAPGNVGFAAAVNLGLSEAWDGEADVLLLNPDARMTAAQLERLQRALRCRDGVAAIGPRLVGERGEPQRASWPVPSPGQVWSDALALGRLWRGRRFVVGAALMLRAEALAGVGPFDERYFLYAEEADWQLRALDGGWRVSVADDVTVTHVGGASSSDSELRERLFHASGEIFARRWYGRRGWWVMRAGSIVAALRRAVTGSAESRLSGRRALLIYLRGPVRTRPSVGSASAATAGTVVHAVRSDGFAGVERYIADVATELDARGWRVVVIGGDSARMRAALTATVTYRPAATVAGVAWQLAKGPRCDVLHAHMTAAEFPAALGKRRLRARLIVTRHFAAADAQSVPGKLARRFIAGRVDRFIAISSFVADAVTDPTTVIHNGTRPFDGVPSERQQTVVLAQRLELEKDTATGLRAWALCRLAEQGWTLVVHGRGSQERHLRALAAELGVESSVQFAGFVDDLRPVFASAGIVVATAPAEPFGLAVVEAMATGVPVVAARGGAHVETLGQHGYFFTAGDAAECAALLMKLADSPGERAALGRRLQDRQRRDFSLAGHVDKLEAVYRGRQ